MRNYKYMTWRLTPHVFIVAAQDFDSRFTDCFYVDTEKGAIECLDGDILMCQTKQWYPYRFRRLHPWIRSQIRFLMGCDNDTRYIKARCLPLMPDFVRANPLIPDLEQVVLNADS